MKKMTMRLNPKAADLLSKSVYAIEATDFEQIWVSNSIKKLRGVETGVSGSGLVTIAHVKVDGEEMPICLAVSFGSYLGQTFVYYEATSYVVDHRIVRSWIKERVPHTAYACNWIHCIQHIERNAQQEVSSHG